MQGQRWMPGRGWLITAASLMVIAGIGLIVLARNWPFTLQAVTSVLEDRFARTVQIRSFRKTYLPPGCVAEGISFLHRQRKDLPPLITVQTLIIRGSYNGLFRIHKRVDEVQVKGLHVLIAPPDPRGQPPNVMPLTTSTSGDSITIGEITVDGALHFPVTNRRVRHRAQLKHGPGVALPRRQPKLQLIPVSNR